MNQALLDRLNAAENEIQLIKNELAQSGVELETLKASKATESTYGLAKISGATTVTEDLGLVLSAREKNATISDTLANQILQAKNDANRLKVYEKQENVVFENGFATFICNLREQGFSGVYGAFVNLVATNETCVASITDMNITAYRLALDAINKLDGTYQVRATYIGT